MNELSIGFTRDTNTALCAKAYAIHTALTTAPGSGYFPVTAPTMPVFKTAIDNLQNAESLENTQTNAALRKSLRDALIPLMQELALGLELAAKGDMVKLSATGYGLNKKPARSTGTVPAPENLRVSTTGIAGEALCKCSKVPLAVSYEAAYTLDPNTGGWTTITPVTSSQNILFTGLSRGKDYYFRVRAIGANGPSGWSDVATMMVV